MVKRILVLLLALIMVICAGFSLTSCKNSNPPDDSGGIETPGEEPGDEPGDEPSDDPSEPEIDPDDPGTEPEEPSPDPDEPSDDEGNEDGGSFQGNRPGKPNREDSYEAK